MGWWRICTQCLPEVYKENSDHNLGYSAFWREPVDIHTEFDVPIYVTTRSPWFRFKCFINELWLNGRYSCDRCKKYKWRYFEVYDMGKKTEEDLAEEAALRLKHEQWVKEIRKNSVPLE